MMIRIVTFSSPRPNSVMRVDGGLVENFLRHLSGLREVDTNVVAPWPWSQLISKCFRVHADLRACVLAKIPHHVLSSA